MWSSGFDFWGFVLGLGVFRRNKVPLELKVLGVVNYIFMSSFRRTARVLSLFKKSARAPCTTG
ncbi:MAG: hypothetical protein QXS27_06065 [Candidatus Jordarchaeaceae archaeon]